MPVDIFGHTNVKNSQRTVAGGVTLSQVNNTFIRSDGETAADGDLNLNDHKLINVKDPVNAQDAVTKSYVDNRASQPNRKFLAAYATDSNSYLWKDFQSIPDTFSESEFDELPAGHYLCYSGYLPATRLGSLPSNTKGYLIALTYQQPADRNKYYKWIDATNGEEWEAYFKYSVWTTWTRSSKVSKSGDTMTGDLSMNHKFIAKLHDPSSPQDAATKNYVDKIAKKCYTGYIPILEANESMLGFIASASIVTSSDFQPFGAFNNLNADGANGSWTTGGKIPNSPPGWLQIQCPERVRIWRVALKARGSDITAWKFAGSNDGTTFTTLLTSTTVLLGAAPAPTYFDIPTTSTYQYYRVNITENVGSVDVGIQVMPLYVYSV